MEEKNKRLLTIAGIINMLEGSLICAYNPMAIFGLFVIGFGLYFLAISNKNIEELKQQKVALLIISIINIPICFISSLIVFIVYDSLANYKKTVNGINAPPEEKETLNPDAKKIDLLLKLGVAMVFISGILFATTTWSFITDLAKAIALILFGVLFVGLSYLTGEKLKLEKSSYVYWILGMLFFLLTVVGAEFFGLFGPFLTFTGEGKYLAYFIVAAVLGALSHITYYKYKKQYLIYITYVSYLIATHNVMMQAKPSIIFSLIVLSVMNIITFVIDKKDKSLNEISNTFVYILALLVCSNIYNEEMIVLKLLGMFISIINLLYLKLNNEDETLSILSMLTTYILVAVTIASFDINIIPKLLIIFILTTIYSLYNNLKENSEFISEVNNVIYTISSLAIYALFLENEVLLSLLVAVIYIILAASSKIKADLINASKIFDMTLPIAIPIIIFPFGNLLGLESDLNFAYGLGVSSATYCVGHYLLKSNTEMKRFLIYGIISTILCLLSSVEIEQVFISIFPILTSLYIMGVFYNHKIKTYVIGPYILYLLSMFIPIVLVNIFDIHIIFTVILFIWAQIMTMILLESKLIQKMTELTIAFPLFYLITEHDLNYTVQTIAISILIIYITYVLVKYFIGKNKCMWSMIGISISLLGVIFEQDIYLALYAGLVGVLVMIIGYNSEKFAKLFKFGIGIIIANIVIQLLSFWEKVPIYLYLLIVGLSIIGFVTYKELKKNNKEKDN